MAKYSDYIISTQTGAGVPSDLNGSDGDLYQDIVRGDWYKKSSGTWTRISVGLVVGISPIPNENDLWVDTDGMYGDIAVFTGMSSGYGGTIQYVLISQPSDAILFGSPFESRYASAGCSNSTGDRGTWAGGSNPSKTGIEYATLSTPSNGVDFGDLINDRRDLAACSNGANDRGLYSGGYDYTATRDYIEYITISTTGNATNYGDLSFNVRRNHGSTSNGTNERALYFGGDNGISRWDEIYYSTISTPGNSVSFGLLNTNLTQISGTSNLTNDRAVMCGGYTTTWQNYIQYVTISSTGNATDFGDLTAPKAGIICTSNGTNDRGLLICGADGSGARFEVDYIDITTTGNASGWGSLTDSISDGYACSNAG